VLTLPDHALSASCARRFTTLKNPLVMAARDANGNATPRISGTTGLVPFLFCLLQQRPAALSQRKHCYDGEVTWTPALTACVCLIRLEVPILG
jgi:hypothetical protein